MVLFISFRDKPYFTCLALALAGLYSNSLLAILNSRIRIEGVHTHPSVQMTAGSSLAFYAQDATSRRMQLPYASVVGRTVDASNTGTHVFDVRIHRHTETWTATDDIIPIDGTVSLNFPRRNVFMTVLTFFMIRIRKSRQN